MYERLLYVIVAAIFGAIIFLFLRKTQIRKSQNATTELDGLKLKTGMQYIVYFWSEHCSQCKSAQKPTLEQLLKKVEQENIELIALCIEHHGSLAKSWGVRTLPTIYVVDQQGSVTHVNNGFVSESRLLQQLNLSTV